MKTLHIKKGDTVQVISGNSKGQKGKVLEVSPAEGKAIVEGVNMVSKHVKPRGPQQAGGIVKTPGPLYTCKLMVVCHKCGKATRVGYRMENGNKVRYCKKCNESI